MLLGPTQRDSRVPSLGLGCGFLSFLGSVDMLHFVSRLLGLSPSTQQRSHSSLTDGLSCSFIWGFLPWACIYPICIPERPLLFLLLPAPLLPFWPCCQRPLVLGWLRRRAWPLKATQVLGSLCDTLGLACGERRRENGLLEVLLRSPFCSLMLRASPLLSSPFPQVE